MNLQEMFPSNYLTKDDLPTSRVLVMTKVTKESVWRKNGRQMAVVLHFDGNVKPMVLNKTNATMIARIYGNDTVQWTNKRIEVFYDPNVTLGRERVGGIRVRAASVVPAKSAPPTTTTTPPTAKPPQNAVAQS
jgi:hypothetical protein